MMYKVIPTPVFQVNFKKLFKKYPSLDGDLLKLIEVLENFPETGIQLGSNLYKIRMANYL